MDKNFILTFLVILSQGRMDRNLTLRNESLFFLVNKTRSYCITWPPRPYSIVNRTRSYCFSLPLRLYCIINISLVHGEEYIRKFSHILYLAWYKSGQLWRPLLNLVLCLWLCPYLCLCLCLYLCWYLFPFLFFLFCPSLSCPPVSKVLCSITCSALFFSCISCYLTHGWLPSTTKWPISWLLKLPPIGWMGLIILLDLAVLDWPSLVIAWPTSSMRRSLR